MFMVLIIVGIRFTPTGVGTAPSRVVVNAEKEVHPHGRGDGGL